MYPQIQTRIPTFQGLSLYSQGPHLYYPHHDFENYSFENPHCDSYIFENPSFYSHDDGFESLNSDPPNPYDY